MLDGGFHLHRKWYRLLEGCFSFRGSRVALKVVQIAGWWLSFAPKVVRTSGRVFFFSWFPCGTEGGTDCFMVALICTECGTDFWKVFFFSWLPCGTEGAGWWLLLSPKVVRTSGRCFSFRGSRVALKVVQIAGWWLSFAPKVVRTSGRVFSFRGSRVALKVLDGGFYCHRKWYELLEGVFLFVVPLWH